MRYAFVNSCCSAAVIEFIVFIGLVELISTAVWWVCSVMPWLLSCGFSGGEINKLHHGSLSLLEKCLLLFCLSLLQSRI